MTARVHCLVSDQCDLSLLPALAAVGVDGFQVRAKTLTTRALIALVDHVRSALAGAAATILVDDRLDVALAAGADGVHLGAEDLPVAHARRLAPDLLLGATCRSRHDVLAAADAGADYAGFGPVFDSVSKAGLPPALGLDAVRHAVGVLPLVAIGGIGTANAAAVRSAGADGVAVIGAIWRDPDPVSAARRLVAAVA